MLLNFDWLVVCYLIAARILLALSNRCNFERLARAAAFVIQRDVY